MSRQTRRTKRPDRNATRSDLRITCMRCPKTLHDDDTNLLCARCRRREKRDQAEQAKTE
jgi:hypothetical protein